MLSVLGADAGGESHLTYAWSTTGTPPAPVTFSPNGTNAAKSTTATFTKAGAYTFQVVITNVAGLTATSTVGVTVNATVTVVAVTPPTATVGAGLTKQFTASAMDQFGAVITPAPSVTWSVAVGGGSISAGGLYTAPASGGTATVAALMSGVTGTATVTIPAPPPTVATPASATPSPVTGKTTVLLVLGADAGGESALTYAWSTTGTPPAPVTFSANGTNAAKNTTATFTKAGSYTFQVVLTNAAGLTATSTISVTVNATVTTVSVTPATATVGVGLTQQFTASATDQFGAALSPLPGVTWSVAAGGGSISTGGLYTAPASAGSATVQALIGGVTGTADRDRHVPGAFRSPASRCRP